jgi:chemotaxis protein CheC
MSIEHRLDGDLEEPEGDKDHVILPSLDVLTELGNMGAGNAATALSTMIDRDVSIDVPTIYVVSPVAIPEILKFYDMHTIAVILQLADGQDCDILLVFSVEEAHKLVRILAEGQEEDSGNLEIIDELGNIIIGNFLSAISDFTGMTLIPAPPTRIEDLFDAILDIFLAKVSLQGREAILLETRMMCEDEDIQAAILMFLSDELQKELVKRGNEWLNL